MNSVEIIDLARTRAGLKSDRQLAKALGIHESRISLVRNQHRKIDDGMAIEIAELIGVPPAYLMALIEAERADSAGDTRVAVEWRRAAKLLKKVGVAAIAAAVLGLSGPPPASGTPSQVSQGDELYIMRNGRRQAAAGPDPRANRTPPADPLRTPLRGRGARRRRRRGRPPAAPGRTQFTVIAGGRPELRVGGDRRVTDRLGRDRRHGSGDC